MLKWFCFCNLSQLSLTLSCSLLLAFPLLPLPLQSPPSLPGLARCFDLIIIPKHSHRIICQGGSRCSAPYRAPRSWLGMSGRACNENAFFPSLNQARSNGYIFLTACYKNVAVSIISLSKEKMPHTVWRQLWDNPADTELISQTEQRDSDALLQTTNPFPETLHNAQWTSIRQSCSTMHATNSHLPRLCPIVITEVKPSLCQILTSPPVQSKAVPGKWGVRQWWLMPGG